MTTHTLNNFFPSVGNFFKVIYNAIIESKIKSAHLIVRGHMMKNRMYRETYIRLSNLSDHELKDIGLTRGDIHQIAMRAYTEDL